MNFELFFVCLDVLLCWTGLENRIKAGQKLVIGIILKLGFGLITSSNHS